MKHPGTALDPLEPLRQGLVPLTSRARAEALKRQVVGQLQAELHALPRRPRRRRSNRRAFSLGALLASVVAIGLCVGPLGARVESGLRVEPDANSQLVWSGTVTELRRLTQADTLPARGKLVVLGQKGARLFASHDVEIVLGGYTRVSLEAMSGQEGPKGLELEQGTLRCDVPETWGNEPFVVRAGGALLSAQVSRFAVTRNSSGPERVCIRVESGQLEVLHAGKRIWLSAGQVQGCGEASN